MALPSRPFAMPKKSPPGCAILAMTLAARRVETEV